VAGGSGGGATYGGSAGAGNTPSTSPSQGNSGGGQSGGSSGGGGGGASAAGTAGSQGQGGAGGAGTASDILIDGSPVYYGGGGGGGSYTTSAVGAGGNGGGGAGANNAGSGVAGTANTGGGGGGNGTTGGAAGNGGAGGSGIVVIRYLIQSTDYSETINATGHGTPALTTEHGWNLAVIGIGAPTLVYGWDIVVTGCGTPALAMEQGWNIAVTGKGTPTVLGIPLDYSEILNATGHGTPVLTTHHGWPLNVTALGSPAVTVKISVDHIYQRSVSVVQKISDKMRRGTIEYDGSVASMSAFYFKAVTISIPDYKGTSNVVFAGFFPSNTETYAAEGKWGTITAFDYAWYLTMQYLSDAQMTLMSSIQQALQKKYYQAFVKNSGEWPIITVGDIVYGETSGAMGTVYEVNYAGQDWFKMNNISGTGYQDGENLLVNGVNISHSIAYGVSMDITGTVTPMRPEDYITSLLGGVADYPRTTMIQPYKINSTVGIWGGTKPEIDFIFDEKTTKIMAIQKPCEYLEFIFLVKPSTYYGKAYFVSKDDIDDPIDGLDLPDPVNVTYGAAPYDPDDPDTDAGAYLVPPVTVESKGEEKYNHITVRCQDMSSRIWYTSVQSTDGVKYDGDPPIMYSEINQGIASQAEADERCLLLYTYYSNQIKTWIATFNLRSDFEFYQILAFSGYGTEIPDGDYRIIGIDYKYSESGTTNQVICTLVQDSQFESFLNLNRIFTDSLSEARAAAQDELNKLGAAEAAVAVDVTDKVVTGTTEKGVTKTAGDPS
jgi:hypothetical protein